MRKTIAIAALAGLAAAATAQPSLQISLEALDNELQFGESTTVNIVVSGVSTLGFNGNWISLNFGLNDNGAGFSYSNLAGATIDSTFPAFNPVTDIEGSAEDLANGNIVLFDATPGGNNAAGFLFHNDSYVIGSFTVTAGDTEGTFLLDGFALDHPAFPGLLIYATALSGTDVYTFIDGATSGFDISASFAGTSITVVPTPGAAALLGLGGVAALRRRR